MLKHMHSKGKPEAMNSDKKTERILTIPIVAPDHICMYNEIPTIFDGAFDAHADATALRRAMKGFGTDEDAVINVVCRRTNTQRIQISKEFMRTFSKDLVKDVRSETSGRFQEVLVGLLTPHFDYLARNLHEVLSAKAEGTESSPTFDNVVVKNLRKMSLPCVGSKESILIDILCTSSDPELNCIQESYIHLYGSSLVHDIKEATSGSFQQILVALCERERCTAAVNSDAVCENTYELYQAVTAGQKLDTCIFIEIFTTRSYAHLRQVFQQYSMIASKHIEDRISNEFTGDAKDALLAIVKSTTNRAHYFAERLNKAMKGLGTNDDLLIFILVSRSEVDLENIKEEYQRLYSRSLASSVHSETSGNYRKALKALLNDNE